LSFSVATYNVLATAYIQRAQYRRSPAMALDPAWRVPALVQYIANLATDVICLQETETGILSALRTRLGPLGYTLAYARKGAGRPDGCATFYRETSFEFFGSCVVQYDNGDTRVAASGDIALVVMLHTDGRRIGLINTHLAWDPPETPTGEHRGYRQVLKLANEWERIKDCGDGWLICGDLNATPNSEVVAVLRRAGFRYAHRNLPETYTCNVGGHAKMIDYLFHSSTLRTEPNPVCRIFDETPLPSAEQPSDHLPVVSKFYWDI
jgi:mRNA deadenylase 3'-5' endonuclease subunit Ccr4